MTHFSNFLEEKSFSKKIILCHTQHQKSFWHHAEIQRNLMIQFQENTRTDGRTQGWTDPISYDTSSYRWGPTSTTAVDWHLKVDDIEYEDGLTKDYYSTVSMQKTSSIHKIMLKIQ